MKPRQCDRELEIAAALHAGGLSAELLEHLQTCSVCSDAVLVSSFLNESAEDVLPATLPSPGLIWWRAQLGQKQELAERSVASISVIRNIAICLAIVLGIVILASVLPRNPDLLLIAGLGFLALLLSVTGVLYAWVHERF